MKDIQSLVNKKSDDATKDKLNNLLIQCLELIDGTRTGARLDIVISHGEQVTANTSDVFRGLFVALEPILIEKSREKANKQFMQEFYSLQSQLESLLK